MTTRRGFLGALLAAASAPVFVRAESLMPVRKIITPPELAPAQTIITTPPGFRIGDTFTMAGVLGASGGLQMFRVTSVSKDSVITVQPARWG